ncbi:CRISPR-associated endonuclease Cas2 [Bacillota bacterium LX-D]|nr:CRISPR-associated endonuclease Cas2 [Bacillota bacterium LX-D]
MLVWVIYDISQDKLRSRVFKICKGYGLYSVQKSVFVGNMEPHEIDELCLRFDDIIKHDEDSVYVFPMCKSDFKAVKLLGQAFDKRLVSDGIKRLFL